VDKIRLGPAGIPIGCKGGTVEGIKYTAEEGLDAFEVEFVRGVRMSIDTAKKVGRVAEENDVLLSCHCPYWINCCAIEEEKIVTTIRNILQTARVANAMGAWIIVFHPGYYMGRIPEDASKVVKNTLRKILDKMHAEDIKDVYLGMETMGEVSQFGTLDEIISISKTMDQTLPVVDFAHIHARGQGCLGGQEDYARIFDGIEKELGDVRLHCHFSEIEFGSKGEIKHLVLGKNSPPFEPLAMEIIERGITPTIISESPMLDRDALRMKEIVENAMAGD
jgi:deoxyribonuclease-4